MTHPSLEKISISQFQDDLIQWFHEHHRELPWRQSKDPYRVWVSEIMLQQTRVDTVIPYYTNFMRKFPDMTTFAEADEEAILKAWEGLGYYSRVRNLQSAVREVVTEYGGVVPDTRESISSLKGVGSYTAGAVLSIAYGKAEPAVDGNVMRVLSRILLIEEDIAKPKTKTIFENLLYDLISSEDPSSFNQGLMELGALVCTPRNPGCLLCPVREHCHAYETGVQDALPIKSKKKKPTPKQLATVILRNQKNDILIEKRPETGLLAGLWQFPIIETKSLVTQQKELAGALKRQFGDIELSQQSLQTVEHVFSHLIWTITVYGGRVEEEGDLASNQRWIPVAELENYTFPVPYHKIIEQSLR